MSDSDTDSVSCASDFDSDVDDGSLGGKAELLRLRIQYYRLKRDIETERTKRAQLKHKMMKTSLELERRKTMKQGMVAGAVVGGVAGGVVGGAILGLPGAAVGLAAGAYGGAIAGGNIASRIFS